MEDMKPKVTLLTATDMPIETIYSVWEASKTNDKLLTPADVWLQSSKDPAYARKVREVFEKVVDAKIPVAENLDFLFALENVSISFREQMVRHRIGVKVGDRLGIDMVPDLADSTWWSQSMRILDMASFHQEGRYRVPDGMSERQANCYHQAMKLSSMAYAELVRSGMSMEDAREVIPLAATHRITWKLNLAALMHIIGKRGCQILQGDLWGPIINGMVNELATKVDPYFRKLIAPPCISGDKYIGCKFKIDNERRVKGEDEIPPCTLYVGQELGDPEGRYGHLPRFMKMAAQYEALWDRNPYFWGERLK